MRRITQAFTGQRSVVTTETLAAEVLRAPAAVRDIYTELLTFDHELLELTEEVARLADVYLERGILTQKYSDDCEHIALATVAEVDLLVSWNFKHNVHYDKIRLFNAVNVEKGYKPLQIYSPREVTSYGEQEGFLCSRDGSQNS